MRRLLFCLFSPLAFLESFLSGWLAKPIIFFHLAKQTFSTRKHCIVHIIVANRHASPPGNNRQKTTPIRENKTPEAQKKKKVIHSKYEAKQAKLLETVSRDWLSGLKPPPRLYMAKIPNHQYPLRT
jgi:hypothetical protein